tara:strand:+ start:236 stop:1006 length:771 start_codon:yes stop_codon:yes gene_type:complete
LPDRRLFISDLHIDCSRPDILAGLLQFLDENKKKCDALYILGDLFEMWIGDDAVSDLKLEVSNKLSEFSKCGPSVYIMHGNRDFLIGNDYAKRCAATILEDHHIVRVGNENLLLLHGDTLCTDDTEYQQFRAVVRNRNWQKDFLSKTVEERRNFAQKARDKSKSDTSLKSDSIMDVNQEEVLKLFKKYHVSKILHGHTHRPAIHELKLRSKNLSPQTAQRIVLGDWDKKGWFAELTDKNVELHSFNLPSKSASCIN